MRSMLIKGPLVVVSVILAIALAEAGLRLTHYGEANQIHLEKFTDYDPVLGWRHKTNFSYELVMDGYRTMLRYDAKGWRGLDRPYAKPQSVFRIVVLGDSFVDGVAVQTEDRFTEILEASLGPQFEVIALGVAAYSTDQELLLLEQEGWKYQPDLVVLAFYFNDVWANGSPYAANATNTAKPVFVTDAGGNLILINVPVPQSASPLRERFKVYNLIRTAIKGNHLLNTLAIKAVLLHGDTDPHPHPRPMGGVGTPDEFQIFQQTETLKVSREWTITQALLRRMKQEAEQREAGLVVFYIPTRVELSGEEWRNAHIPSDYDPGKVARRLGTICKIEGIPYIEPSDRFRERAEQGPFYYPDTHWNPSGNHLAAQILAEYVRGSWRRAQP